MANIKEHIKSSIKLAKECVEETTKIEKDYKNLAFKVVLEYLLNSGTKYRDIDIKYDKSEDNENEINIKGIKTYASFLRRLNAKSHTDKILSMAYYLLKIKNKPIFTKSDIESEYKYSLIPKSKNMAVEFNSLLKRGFIMNNDERVDGKKSFSITIDGIEYVEENLIKQ